MKQFLKPWIVLGLGILGAGGGYWIHYNTSWHHRSTGPDYIPGLLPFSIYYKQNGAWVLVRRFPIKGLKGLRESLDERIFRWAKGHDGAECFMSPFPAAYASAVLRDGETRRMIMYVASETFVEWHEFTFPIENSYRGELSQFLRSTLKGSGSLDDFKRTENRAGGYALPIENGKILHLPHGWYSTAEEVGVAPMFTSNQNYHSVTYKRQNTQVTLYPSGLPQDDFQKEMKENISARLVRNTLETAKTCGVKEYAAGESKEVGWFVISKGVKICGLSARLSSLRPSTDVLAGTRPLAEHIAREWAKLPD